MTHAYDSTKMQVKSNKRQQKINEGDTLDLVKKSLSGKLHCIFDFLLTYAKFYHFGVHCPCLPIVQLVFLHNDKTSLVSPKMEHLAPTNWQLGDFLNVWGDPDSSHLHIVTLIKR